MRTNAQRPLQKKRSQINARMQTQKKKKNTWKQIKRKDKFINATAVHTCWSLRKWWWQPLGSHLGEFQPWLHSPRSAMPCMCHAMCSHAQLKLCMAARMQASPLNVAFVSRNVFVGHPKPSKLFKNVEKSIMSHSFSQSHHPSSTQIFKGGCLKKMMGKTMILRPF